MRPIDDGALHGLAALEAHQTANQAGVVHVARDGANNRDGVGRFGWKAQTPSLKQFTGDALLNEMGITNPDFPNENCPQGNGALLTCNPAPGLNEDARGVAKITDFMRFLAPPSPLVPTSQTVRGRVVFKQVGCNSCHTEKLRTGQSEVAALSNVEFQPFSDFLLHDMGALGDGITQGRATGRMMRTAPLWGARVRTRFLHEDAPRRSTARDAFNALPAADRAALLAFVNAI